MIFSCLENTHASQFADGELLYHESAVSDIFQIGFFLLNLFFELVI